MQKVSTGEKGPKYNIAKPECRSQRQALAGECGGRVSKAVPEKVSGAHFEKNQKLDVTGASQKGVEGGFSCVEGGGGKPRFVPTGGGSKKRRRIRTAGVRNGERADLCIRAGRGGEGGDRGRSSLMTKEPNRSVRLSWGRKRAVFEAGHQVKKKGQLGTSGWL